MKSRLLPQINTEIPGPRSCELIGELQQFESPAITARRYERSARGYLEAPIVWARTEEMFVEDVDGNRFLDFTAAFGVATAGHSHPKVVQAGCAQLERMSHAMGDAFPARSKVKLARKLAEVTPGGLKRSLFGSAGFEAVEAGLKTAAIKTGKPRILAFDGAYHGLGYGALAVTGYKDRFRDPFLAQLNPHVLRAPYPYCYRCPYGKSYPDCSLHCLAVLERRLRHPASGMEQLGCVIIEPIQGRGGVVEAPLDYLQGLRRLTDELGIVLIADEIYSGFGRTGEWFAVDRAGIVPDLICVGKGMTGGFPISAAIGTDEVMDGWGDSRGEAIHTSTFLGNPLGCEMALATIEALEEGLIARVPELGARLEQGLRDLMQKHSLIGDVRGAGLMLGAELVRDRESLEPASHEALVICRALLEAGVILLPSGIYGNVLSFSPPYIVDPQQIDFLLETLNRILDQQPWN